MRALAVLVAIIAQAGCYASHERDPCGVDPFPERSWRDAIPPPDGAPALEWVGEPVVALAGVSLSSAGSPSLAWNGHGFGLAASGEPAEFVELGADGVPLAPPVPLARAAAVDLDFACGRYGVAFGTNGAIRPTVGFGILDETGVALAGWTGVGPVAAGDVSAIGGGATWALVGETTPGDVSVRVLGSDSVDVVVPRSLARDASGPQLVTSSGERTLVLWREVHIGVGPVVMGQTLVEGVPAGVPVRVASRVDVAPAMVAVEVRGQIAFVGSSFLGISASGSLELAFFDPAHLAETTPRRIAPAYGVIDLALAAAPNEGFVVVCTSSAIEGRAAIELIVVGLDGRSWGTPLRLEGEGDIGLACGWGGEDVVVAWTRTRDGADRGVVVARARPTFL